MKEELLLLRNQLKMGHRISFAEAMLLQRAIDILVNKTGNSPAQSDCCPAQGGNSLVIPDEMTSGQAYEIGYYYGDPVDVFARGANWMRQHIIDSTLAAAPQEVKGE